MEVLINKQTKSYDYLSRYATFPFYYHTEDKKYIYGLTKHLNTNIEHVIVDIEMSTTLDSLANKYYGRPDYWWIIADFNRISDPFIQLFGNYETLKIPSMAAISYED